MKVQEAQRKGFNSAVISLFFFCEEQCCDIYWVLGTVESHDYMCVCLMEFLLCQLPDVL